MMPAPTRLADEERASGAPGVRGGEPHHQPQLDGVRGLAILGVLLTHVPWMVGGLRTVGATRFEFSATGMLWGGVDLFFALSGFLITGILLRSRHSPKYFKTFYVRRVLRIFPIYYLTLVVSLLVALLPFVAARSEVWAIPPRLAQRVSYFLYLQNIPLFWPTVAAGLTGLWGAYWSLAVEEQFYFVWPSLIRFLRTRWVYVFCVVGVAAGPLVRIAVGRWWTGTSLGLQQFPITRLDGLFAGAACALYRDLEGTPVPKRWCVTWLLLGLTILAAIATAHPWEMIRPDYYMERFGISGFALGAVGLIGLTQHNLGAVKAIFGSRMLTYFGKYSYGIYVYHLFVFEAFNRICWRLIAPNQTSWRAMLMALPFQLAAILTAVGVARLSYALVEAPFLSLKRFFPSAASHEHDFAAERGGYLSVDGAQASGCLPSEVSAEIDV